MKTNRWGFFSKCAPLWRLFIGPRARSAGFLAVASAACLAFSPLPVRAETPVWISVDFDSVTVTPNKTKNFIALNVRISNPDGVMALNRRSTGEPVIWTPSVIDADGLYNFEVIVVTSNHAPEPAAALEHQPDLANRIVGSFELKDGRIVIPDEHPSEDSRQEGFWRDMKVVTVTTARVILELLSPRSAYASDLISSSNSPLIFFDDLQDEDCTPTYDWIIRTDGGAANDDVDNYFKIIHYGENAAGTVCGPDITIVELRNNGSSDAASSVRSMIVEVNGDIRFADSAVYLDKSIPWVGIGTTGRHGNDFLTLSSLQPQIGLRDESDNSVMAMEYDEGWWELENTKALAMFRVHRDSPNSSLVVNPTGNVGIGTSSPAAKLDIRGETRSSFSGSFSSGDGLKTLFKMSSSNTDLGKTSDAGFSIKNEKLAFEWAFRTYESGGATGFAMTKMGTGGAEVLITNPTTDFQNVALQMGNGAECSATGQWLNASSREYKENIRQITPTEALQTLQGLNPVTYSFKRDDSEEIHVGFIAEEVPELVGTKDRKTLNSLEIVAVLTKVVQEQQAVIARLNERISELEKK